MKQGLYLKVLFRESFADTTPLFGLISQYVNEDMLAAIAREYAKGRVLLIGTTNLDEQRGVFWNIGAIAASGKPGAVELVRKLLLASAAVPGLFPPVMIDVELNGRHFQEMHVDGGAARLLDPEPGDVEGRQEEEGQQGCGQEAADDRIGHRPPGDFRGNRDHALEGFLRGDGQPSPDRFFTRHECGLFGKRTL